MTQNNAYLPTPDTPQDLDDATLDLLVDGELSPAARRELLARLDGIPGGWRRCALAFLEAQSWREDFRAIPRQPEVSPRPTVSAARPAKRSWWTVRNIGTLAAMGASFLVALGLSLLVRQGWQPAAPSVVPEQVAEVALQGKTPAMPEPSGKSPTRQDARQWNMAGGPWTTVSLPVSNGAEPIELPARERDTVDEAWLDHLPSAIPQEILHALQESGHHVDLQRRLMPFPMKDGRQLVVPVDQIDVHPVGYPSYQ